MAQRISRAKRTLQGRRLDQPGDLAVVLRVLYLVYTAGHQAGWTWPARRSGSPASFTATEEPEARGLLALMLLNHARLPARFDAEGRIVTLDRQDRGLWDTREIAEGVRVLRSALAVQRLGRYQIEAAIAALHDDAARAEETRLAADPRLVRRPRRPHRRPGAQGPCRGTRARGRGGHVLGAAAGLREHRLAREVLGERHRCTPSAATCTSSAATSRPPPRRPPRPHAGRRTSPNATTWFAKPPARGPAELCRNSRLAERPHRLACPAMKCTDHGSPGAYRRARPDPRQLAARLESA